MTHSALSPRPLTRAALAISPRAGYLLAMAGVLLVGAWGAPSAMTSLGLLVLGMTFVSLAFLVRFFALRHIRLRAQFFHNIEGFVEHDAAPSFTTDLDGRLTYRNKAARERFENAEGETLAGVLGDLFASPAAVLSRLKNKAHITGSAREDVVLRRGHMRLSVHQIGGAGFLWRLEEIGDRSQAGRTGESINLPMMTVSRTGTILFMNESMRRLLGGRQTALDRVFTELPISNGTVASVSTLDGNVLRLVCEIDSTAGRREIYLLPEPKGRVVEPSDWDLVDALPVPLLKLDQEGRVSMANRRARLLLGAEAPVGNLLSELVEGAGRPISEWLRDVLAGRPTGRSEVVRALKPSNDVFLQVSLERISEPDGKVLVAILQDATELKTMEAQYLQSQKMQAIGQLAGGVAHDFNNLLTAISGHCDLLLLRHEESDQDYADLSQIHQNANRAATLVGQLLSFSRKQTLRPEAIDLTETLDDLTHLLNRLVGETVELVLRQDQDLLPIRADKRHLEQVLMNLVVNARDAMPRGGEIRIETRNMILSTPLVRDRATVPEGEYVQIKVVDQGTGIAPDKLGKVFEPFFTTKGAGKGTGLGLSMAYGIVKQTGGFIFVDSDVGSGTVFTLFFPVADQAARSPGRSEKLQQAKQTKEEGDPIISSRVQPLVLDAPLKPPQAVVPEPETSLNVEADDTALRAAVARVSDVNSPAQGNSCSTPQTHEIPQPTHPEPALTGVILLVEDEAPVRAFASRALRMRGYTVLEAENAEDALKTLEDQSLEVDIFVTDVIMPGMDGPTWVSEALKNRPGVKVVFVSGYAEDSVSEHQARIPNSVFLPKPFSLSELTSTVQRQLH